MTAIKTGKLDDAYDLLAPDLQSRISQDVFVRSFVDADLKSWSFSTRNIDEFAGFVRGTSMMRGQQYVVELEFSKIDERWLITRYLMEPQ